MAATAEMLAAGAQGGSAGVQAYMAAQQEIAARQQATIAQMQADAIKRNSPNVAGVGAQSVAGTDALLNQLAVLQANAGAEDASRSARMSDYGRQAAMAGGLIPLQAQADAALIRARGDIDLQRIRAQGQNDLESQRLSFANSQAARAQEQRDRVEYIKWQMRQQSAKDSAEAAAKAAKENTPTQTELEAMATLAARDVISGKAAEANRKLASAPSDPFRATKQANGSYVLDPSIRKAPTAQTAAWFTPSTGPAKKKGEAPGTPARRDPTKDTPYAYGFTPSTGPATKSTSTTRPTPARLSEMNRQATASNRAVVDARSANSAYADPLVMRDEVARQGAALRDQGYTITPEMLAVLTGQPFLSAQQMDLRDAGQPYTEAQMYAAFNRDQAMGANAPDGYDEARSVLSTAFGYDFDSLVKSEDITPDAAAAYITGAAGDIEGDLTALDSMLNGDPDNAEIDAWFRKRGVTPAQEKILRALKGL